MVLGRCTASRTASGTCSTGVISAQIGVHLHPKTPINPVSIGDFADLRTGCIPARAGIHRADDTGSGESVSLSAESGQLQSQTVLFPNLFDKLLLARFDQPHTSSDGGAVLLNAAEKVYGPVAGFVHCLVDRREPGKVRHTLADLLGQRIFGIACGHPDGNDAERLADDSIHKLLLERDPVAGAPLAP